MEREQVRKKSETQINKSIKKKVEVASMIK